MSSDEDQGGRRRLRLPEIAAEDASALSWLARWIGIPFVIIIGLYYAEPWLRPLQPEFVQTVTRQEVHPYPFPDGSSGPSLAPPEVVRIGPLPRPALPLTAFPQMPAGEIVAHPIAQPQPVYPQRALEQEKEGVVRLRVTIAADGTVADAVVLFAKPQGWFEEAALAAVRRWRYQPPGRVLATEAEIEFRLN